MADHKTDAEYVAMVERRMRDLRRAEGRMCSARVANAERDELLQLSHGLLLRLIGRFGEKEIAAAGHFLQGRSPRR
jgi:hypothetical protein